MKIRNDFVSNSSSSSYIVAVAEPSVKDAAQDIVKAVYSDDLENTQELFETKTILTCAEIQYETWNDNTCLLQTNFIPVGICINDNELAEYFGDDGEVRNDLDPLKIIKKLSWYNYDSYDENEEIIYESILMGKVTDKTFKFTKWLYDKAIELYGNEAVNYCTDNNTEEELSTYEKAFTEGKSLYFVRFSYDGDGQNYGYIYIDNTNNFSKSIKQMMLDSSKNIKDVWFIDL